MAMQRIDWNSVADAAEARVGAWIATLRDDPLDAGQAGQAPEGAVPTDMLEGARTDSDAFGFTHRLLDAVVGASDPFAAAMGLREASRDLPSSMPAVERMAVRAGGLASLGLPWAVLPVARKWLRDRVSHLVLSERFNAARERSGTGPDTDDGDQELFPNLAAAAKAAASAGSGVLLALGGDEVLGDAGAATEIRRLKQLISKPEVEHVAVDVSRVVPPSLSGAWGLDADAEAGASRLREILEHAMRCDTTVVLEPNDYCSALLAPQILAQALGSHELRSARVGVLLPAELPESLQIAEALAGFSASRVAAGGAPLELVLGVAGFSGREQIRSIITGLAIPTFDSHEDRAAQLLRLMTTVLARGNDVRAVVASEDPHLLAAATILAERLNTTRSLSLQLRAGVASSLESVIADHGFSVRRRLPVVPQKEFTGAVVYLIALAAETADAAAAISRTRALLAGDGSELGRGADRLRATIDRARAERPESRRVQQRALEWSDEARDTVAFYRAPTDQHPIETGGLTAAVLGLTRAQTGAITLEVSGPPLRVPVVSDSGFANEPATDASRYENRVWVRELIDRAQHGQEGVEAVRAARTALDEVDARISAVLEAGERWHELRPADRGIRVGRLALGAAAARDRLIEVLAAETGAPVEVLDAEVNGAVDAARYQGQLASALGAVRGARFVPERLTLVVADAGVPLAERAEAVLAAVAAGSAVLVVSHPSGARAFGVLLEEWQAAGLPTNLITLVTAEQVDAASADQPGSSSTPVLPHETLATVLAADARVNRAIVLGKRETARMLLRRRPDLQIEGRFRAPGVVAVTPTADPARAVRHIVASAFGAQHNDSTVARVVVLLGAVARSSRFQSALADAIGSLRVGDTARPRGEDPLAFNLGPLPEPPGEAGLRALTELDPGEEWLVQPRQLDDEGLLWQPGVRIGLTRGARFWSDAQGMPVIGVITAHSVDEMISLTRRLGGGGVAALCSNDPSESLPWLERVPAAKLVLDGATTGGRIERQPAGGWGQAGMGGSALAGGPHRMQSLGSWELREGTASSTLHLRGLTPEVRILVEAAQPSLDYRRFDRVRRALLSDALTWRTLLGRAQDVTGLGIERNLLRHLPVATHVRHSEGAPLADLVRVIAAGLVAGAAMTVSTGVVLPPEIAEFLTSQGVPVALERDEHWLERMAVAGLSDDEVGATRIRLIGGDRARTAEWLGRFGEIGLWAAPVTMAGPVELLAFVREQSISITAHRHGLALMPAGIGGWIAELQGRR